MIKVLLPWKRVGSTCIRFSLRRFHIGIFCDADSSGLCQAIVGGWGFSERGWFQDKKKGRYWVDTRLRDKGFYLL